MTAEPSGRRPMPERPKPKPTEACIDLGHHGRERCVFCGLERAASGSREASDGR